MRMLFYIDAEPCLFQQKLIIPERVHNSFDQRYHEEFTQLDIEIVVRDLG